MKTILFKLFEKYSEKTLISSGIIFTLLGSFLAYTFNIRFDGILDLHVVNNTSLFDALSDNLINVICLTLFLYISSKYINRKTRLIDIVSTAMVARTPLYILPIFNINKLITKSSEELIEYADPELIGEISPLTWLTTITFGIITMIFIIWYITLLFNGFKVASNAKGKVPIVLFILSLLLAEILSKFLIIQLT
ncbi:hypothetical protein QSE00_23905 [Arenibacter sp. M-2]|uniref:hypothetical protein n=1 Tax=Arenibacter sp. M-2 TaxID=3053612 RepID=UPI002570CFF9|nr:hypothetical protein [Arenibacter sp. M-2]MDL5514876.1 hypothetical protein [Arenibacter sp. M-2]